MSEALKRCPFCGSEAHISKNYPHPDATIYRIGCPTCLCYLEGEGIAGLGEAASRWNARAQPAAERTEEGEDEGEAWEPDEFSDGPYTNLADGRMEPAADIDAPEYGDMQLWYPREEWYPLLCAWRTFAARVSALEAEKGALENQLLGSSDCIKFTQEPQ
jgi:hypothetical protein